MSRSVQFFLAMLVAIILLLIIPMVVGAEYNKITKRNETEYRMSEICWEIEDTGYVPLAKLSKYNYVLTFKYADGSTVDYIQVSDGKIPINAKYFTVSDKHGHSVSGVVVREN